MLAQAKADLDHAPDTGKTPLVKALADKHGGVVRLLLHLKACPNAVCSTGSVAGLTPLYVAASLGAVDVMLELVRAKADVNCATEGNGLVSAQLQGTTALYMAARNGQERVVRALLGAKADVNYVPVPNAQTPVRPDETPLCAAARNGHVAVLLALAHAGADTNRGRTNSDVTPTVIAAGYGRSKALTALLSVKAALGRCGEAAVAAAARGGHAGAVQVLLRAKVAMTLADCTALVGAVGAAAPEGKAHRALVHAHNQLGAAGQAVPGPGGDGVGAGGGDGGEDPPVSKRPRRSGGAATPPAGNRPSSGPSPGPSSSSSTAVGAGAGAGVGAPPTPAAAHEGKDGVE
jgi:hypothetical protein